MTLSDFIIYLLLAGFALKKGSLISIKNVKIGSFGAKCLDRKQRKRVY